MAMGSQSESLTTDADTRSPTRPCSEVSNPTLADLPICLLEIIMSLLVLKDNICASAACKSWLEAAKSVRVAKKNPWLMCFPNRGNLYEFHNPFQWKLYTMNLPELAISTVCYAREGWLLAHRSISKEIFFFNPFSRELISLPKFEPRFLKFAFSSPPTSDKVVVLALYFPREDIVIISTCHPGATEWITGNFLTGSKPDNDLVYVNNRFYCFNTRGGTLYSFLPSPRIWHRHTVECPYPQPYLVNKTVSLAEKKGALFLITCSNEKTMMYKLVSLQWKEMRSPAIDGLTIFVSSCNSELRTNLPWLKNNVYFSRFGRGPKHCLSYSFDESRYSQIMEWLEFCPRGSLWIDPPENVLVDL
ncbi:F-box protein [Cardamine amara subsp. amara]|uniref:F-box protein n=1 Tax=Cardamine amara subsp. amara TaxID=228776 RepID=A0ABD1BS37_CARAN